MKTIYHYAAAGLLAGLLIAGSAHAQQSTSATPKLPMTPIPPAATQQQANIDPKTLAAAKDLVRSFDMSNMFQGLFDAMMRGMMPIIARDNSTQVQQAQAVALDAVKKTFMAHMGELENNKATVYAQMYSIDELQQLKTFYQSPVGQKMLKTMPEMMQRSMVLDHSVMMTAMSEAKHAVADALRKNGMTVPKEMGL